MTDKRILVVDDEEQVGSLIAQVISEAYPDLEVKLAANGVFALEQLQERGYALLLTDYDMPKMNGLQLASMARHLSPDTRIVLMSGRSALVLKDRLFSSCALDGFLTKPFSIVQILSIVDNILNSTASAGR